MLSYSPRSIRKDGVLTGWDYTYKDHFGKIHPAGYCAEHKDKGNHGGHHTNPKDAVKCFSEYVIDHLEQELGRNFVAHPCQNCRVQTFGCIMLSDKHEGAVPFVSICGNFCLEQFKKNLREALATAEIDVYAETCDDGK